MNEKPIEWCLLWFGPCLPSAEWASWAQAIFSAAAVFAAIGVVWWQHHVTACQRLAASQLSASGMLTLMGQTIGGIQSTVQGLNELVMGQPGSAYSLAHLSGTLATLPFPTKDELLALNGELPACATKLLRASSSMVQVRTALDTLVTISNQGADQESVAELLRPIVSLATEAAKAFIEAEEELNNFCPK